MNREALMKLQGRARDLALVQNEDLWLNWPVQTMVRRDRAPGNMALENCGLLIAGHDLRVYQGNLFTGPTRGVQPEVFVSWDSLLDVWRVD